MATTLTIPLPPRFSLPHAVCSYGYFILAPNRWDSGTQTLHRPLRDTRDRVVRTRITQPAVRTLRIACHRTVARAHHAHLKRQVTRILRLDADPAVFNTWHKQCPPARRAKFDRLYRSPSLFEDIVKTFTSCNVAWPNTIRMNQLLCEAVGRGGDFPTPAELAAWSPTRPKAATKVGYRAERIIRLARDVHTGRLDLAWFEHPARTTDELYEHLIDIYGVGDYAANNILQHLGRYDRLPIDSETLRHFRQFHNHTGDGKDITSAARTFYDRYAPFQFLAYWFELWGAYEKRFGSSQQWTEDIHDQFTANKLK